MLPNFQTKEVFQNPSFNYTKAEKLEGLNLQLLTFTLIWHKEEIMSSTFYTIQLTTNASYRIYMDNLIMDAPLIII